MMAGIPVKICCIAMCSKRAAEGGDLCTHHEYLAPTIGFKGDSVTHYEGTIAEFTECLVQDCKSPQEYGFPYCKEHNVPANPTPAGQFSEDVFQICLEVKDILQKKNQDYGNSAHEQFLEYGQTSYNLRIEDKLRRLKHLAKNPAQVDEKIEETILDLIGYGILYLKSVREVNQDGRKQSTTTISS